jgi:hypothetical protein
MYMRLRTLAPLAAAATGALALAGPAAADQPEVFGPFT